MNEQLVTPKIKKKKRRLRRCVYDLIIYVCLFGALICLIIGSNQYLESIGNKNIIDTVKQVFLSSPEKSIELAPVIDEIEPSNVEQFDKTTIISNYIENIKDRIINDDFLTYDTVITWQSYNILNLTYNREVTDNYYEYILSLSLNKEATLPVSINNRLSTDEYNVITLKVYFYESDNNYIIKNITSLYIEK